MNVLNILSLIKKYGPVIRLGLAIGLTLAAILILNIYIFLSMLVSLMTLSLGFGG
jgi:hypothetical protein